MTETIIDKDLFHSVVKIHTVKCAPNFSMPWNVLAPSQSTSSGFIIDNKRIMCTAHGVVWARSIRVSKHGNPQKYNATVEHISHDTDLAILVISDAEFWEEDPVTPLTFDDKIPELQDTISLLGYPTGGKNICVTKGVVSRVSCSTYTHGGKYNLVIQIDAAINSGVSGGPAIINNKVVGVAFQSRKKGQNIGYCVPIIVVQWFLNGLKKFDNNETPKIPVLGINTQLCENESMQRHLQMRERNIKVNVNVDSKESEKKDDSSQHVVVATEKETEAESKKDKKDEKERTDTKDKKDKKEKRKTGVFIARVSPLSKVKDVLRVGDVLLSYNSTKIANDGTIPFRFGERISYTWLQTQQYFNDKAEVELLRNGELMKLTVELSPPSALVPYHLFDKEITYFIFGGLVFIPLSANFLKAKYGGDWTSRAPVELVNHYYSSFKEFDNEEIVILAHILPNPINDGYHQALRQCPIVQKCNDIEIENTRHLASIIDNLDSNESPFVTLQVSPYHVCIMDVEESREKLGEILKSQNIACDRSDNLKNIGKDEFTQKDKNKDNEKNKKENEKPNDETSNDKATTDTKDTKDTK